MSTKDQLYSEALQWAVAIADRGEGSPKTLERATAYLGFLQQGLLPEPLLQSVSCSSASPAEQETPKLLPFVPRGSRPYYP